MAPTTKAVKGSRTAQAPFCGNIAKSSVERTRTAQAPPPSIHKAPAPTVYAVLEKSYFARK